MNNIVIIGAGHAGGMAAILLRKLKFNGSIIIVGDESFLPYQKPALSKTFLSGEIRKELLFLRKLEFYKKNNIATLLESKVKSLNRHEKCLILENNKKIPYSKLIIATGSYPIKLNTKTSNNDINYLRTINDSENLKSKMNTAENIGIIGAGYIGLEIASVARKRNLDVTIIEYQDRVMSRVVSPVVSSFFQSKHESHNVKFIFKKSAVDIQKTKNCQKILLSDNTHIDRDLVAIGIGVQPNTIIAENSGLDCNNGIIVDMNCITSDENIYAIGDCANHLNDIFNERMRLESVQNAVDQAKTAAAHIVGKPSPYNEVPWFWTDQYEITLQIAGQWTNYDDQIVKGSIDQEKFSVIYFMKNKLVAVEAINSPKDFLAGKKLIKSKIEVDKTSLKENNLDLKSIMLKN